MKEISRVLIVCITVLLVLQLTACSASSTSAQSSTAAGAKYEMAESAAEPTEYYEDPDPGTGGGDYNEISYDAVPGATGGGTGQQQSLPSAEDSARKLIRRITVALETKEYDVLSAAITQQLAAMGGYAEESRQEGDAKSGTRTLYLVARVPAAQADAFLTAISQHGGVRSRWEGAEDVTLSYVDVESHKKSLEIEQERLLSLLEQAQSIEDIIALESRLSEVRYELESYASQIRLYDNLINYTTVTLNVYEVERITPVEEKTVWNRISTGFEQSLYRVADGGENFFVWVVVNLPFLLIWAIVITGAVLLIRRALNKRAIGGKNPKRKGLAVPGVAQSAPEIPAQTEEKTPTPVENNDAK